MPGPRISDPSALVRRIGATVQLAAQEYALGVKDGKIVLAARGRGGPSLPDRSRKVRRHDCRPDRPKSRPASTMFSSWFSPPRTRFRHRRRREPCIDGLASRYQIALDRRARPAAVARARRVRCTSCQCARCHGGLGQGDGPDGEGPRPAARESCRCRRRSPTRRPSISIAGSPSASPGTAMPVLRDCAERRGSLGGGALRQHPPASRALRRSPARRSPRSRPRRA